MRFSAMLRVNQYVEKRFKMNNKEYEYKKLLTLKEYKDLILKLSKKYTGDEFVQVNYYYDDNNFTLFNKNETVRVRQKTDKLSLERKFNKKYSANGKRVCEEKIDTIDNLPMNLLIDYNEYNYIGNLVTIRKNYFIDNCIISLDANYYLGKVDYELEIESNEDFLLPRFITKLVDLDSNAAGKYTRFVDRLKEIKFNHDYV